jgi:hypothetical protein
MVALARGGWKLEQPLDLATVKKPGKLDAVLVRKASWRLSWLNTTPRAWMSRSPAAG